LGRLFRKIVVDLDDALFSQLEKITREKNITLDKMVISRIIHSWIGKTRIVPLRVYEESSDSRPPPKDPLQRAKKKQSESHG
jgi:hypothetical protein